MRLPKPKTLAKYGLSEEDWRAILKAQGGVCPICKRVPNGQFRIDHDHVRGWGKLPPEKRKLHVRGLLCYFHNRFILARRVSIQDAKNLTEYLEAHVDRIMHGMRRTG